ncbi:CTLH/CRA C-terminal to lish motif domain-containing protein [Dunaliella salina]|uniref:CTLH/CRA C-terminal to lish motif domain-containing protein n=1 Tax=Dunaliella salina TaxID=3046 RepID=A0ABQ7G6I5_DUNSA|nr:CTLH/CRA C-terminal to lish motif domain-containing protein [Dunaliella salina]|eukprot:KAF5842388.1 CTLH/CRA C-terminal to lish motif domain-containing protein [Dunaliella salina]
MSSSTVEPIQAASSEAAKVVKRQRTCEHTMDERLDQAIALVQHTAAEMRSLSSPADIAAATSGLQAKLDGLLKESTNQTKELHSGISKLNKALDRFVDDKLDICKAMRDIDMDQATLNKVIAEHFFREGRFEVGDVFAQEARIPDVHELKAPYIEMHKILEQIRARNLEPALQWAVSHAGQLPESSGSIGYRGLGSAGKGSRKGPHPPSAFEFKLHALNFLTALTQQGQEGALAYAKQHFAPFQRTKMKEIMRLMGCLVYLRPTSSIQGGFAGSVAAADGCEGGATAMAIDDDQERPQPEHTLTNGTAKQAKQPLPQFTLAGTPYAELMSPSAWEDVAQEFVRQACSLMGQAYESPLAVSVAAGALALPPLLKLASVMERNAQDLRSCEQLPVELELGDEFVFHPIFACPVSKDHATPDNPPVLLPCNHVLCEHSVLKIAKGRTRTFKCPYCPMDARADNLRALIFPDVD